MKLSLGAQRLIANIEHSQAGSNETAAFAPFHNAYFNRDSTRVLTIGNDRVSLTSIDTPDTPILSYHHQGVIKATFNDSETAVASWGGDAIQIWDVASRSQSASMQHAAIADARFSKTSKEIISWGGVDVRVWDTDGSLPPIETFPGAATGAAFSANNQLLVTQAYQPANQVTLVHVWQRGSSTPVATLNSNGGAMLSENKQMFLTYWKGRVTLVHIDSLPLTFTEFLHDNVHRLMFDPVRNQFLSLSTTEAHIWRCDEATAPLSTLPFNSGGWLGGATFSSNGSKVAIWGGSVITIWGVTSPRPTLLASYNHQSIHNALFAPSGDQLLSWGGGEEIKQGGDVRLCTLQPNMRPTIRTIEKGDYYSSCSFSKDGRHVVVPGSGRTTIWDSRNPAAHLCMLPHLHALRESMSTLSGAEASADGSRILCWGRGSVKVWQISASNTLVSPRPLSTEKYRCFAGSDVVCRINDIGDHVDLFSLTDAEWKVGPFEHRRVDRCVVDRRKRRLLTYGGDIANVWDLSRRERLGQFSMSGRFGHRLQFTSDASEVLTFPENNGDDASLITFSSGSVKVQELFEHKKVVDVALSESDTLLVTCGEGTVKVWKTTPAQEMISSINVPGVKQVAIATDEKHVITMAGRGRVELWRIDKTDVPIASIVETGASRMYTNGDIKSVLLTTVGTLDCRLWSFDDSQRAQATFYHGMQVAGCHFHPSEQLIISWGETDIKVWDIRRPGAPLCVCTYHQWLDDVVPNVDSSGFLVVTEGKRELWEYTPLSYKALGLGISAPEDEVSLEIVAETGTRIDGNGKVVGISGEEWASAVARLREIKE